MVVAAIFFQLRGVLLGRVFFFEDVAAYFGPLFTAAARALRAGHLPSWEPGAFSGQPLLGDPQIGVLYPPHWLAWLTLAPLRAYALLVLAHSLWAAGGAYALARTLGRSRVAAGTSAIALSLSAFFVLETRHLMFLASASFVPWLLLAVVRQIRSGRAIAGIAVCFALCLLAGGWSMLVFATPVVLIFIVARHRASGASRDGLLRVGGVALGFVLGAGLAAPQLLPALAHARLSPRALPLASAFATSYAWPSLRYAVTLVAPRWYGDEALGTYVGAPDQWELCGYGAGLVVALLALASLSRRRGRTERLLFVALIGVAMLAALGEQSPLYALWRRLPLVGRARCPARALFVYTLIAPLLAADGVDWLRARFRRRARYFVALPLVVAIELLVTFVAENPTVPLREARIVPAVLRAIPRAPSDGRTLLDVHLGQAFHNGGLRWNIESPGGYSSLPLWRYLHLLWIANDRAIYPGPLAHDLSAQGLWTLDSPLVDLLNVRWLLAPHDRPPSGSGWIALERGADGIDLWRNEEALPRAFVVHGARVVADELSAARAIAAADFDPARQVVVEEPLQLGDEGAAPEPARLVARDHEDARYAVTTTASGVLVLSEPHEPSWTVEVDGRPAPLLRVDYALMGVRLEAGTHEVAFTRIDRPLRRGLWISLLSLGMVLLASSIRRRRPTR